MAATAAQIASARALAASRGYDPNLVDADNADRASTAFPIQAKPAAPQSAPSAPQPAAQAPAPDQSVPSVPASTPQPSAAAPNVAAGAPVGTVADTSSTSSSSPATAAMTGLQNISTNPMYMPPVTSPAAPSMNLRQTLGTRLYPQDSSALAGLKRAY